MLVRTEVVDRTTGWHLNWLSCSLRKKHFKRRQVCLVYNKRPTHVMFHSNCQKRQQQNRFATNPNPCENKDTSQLQAFYSTKTWVRLKLVYIENKRVVWWKSNHKHLHANTLRCRSAIMMLVNAPCALGLRDYVTFALRTANSLPMSILCTIFSGQIINANQSGIWHAESPPRMCNLPKPTWPSLYLSLLPPPATTISAVYGLCS